MAPAQVIEIKDLPPELVASAVPAAPMAASGDQPSPAATAPSPAAAPSPEAVVAATAAGSPHWLDDLEREALTQLQAGAPAVWDGLTRQFEARLIRAALAVTRGRRIEAAQKLGIGRNTITRKIQELGLDD